MDLKKVMQNVTQRNLILTDISHNLKRTFNVVQTF